MGPLIVPLMKKQMDINPASAEIAYRKTLVAMDRLESEHGRIVITKHGRAAAIVLSIEDLESLEETLDVMGSRTLLEDIREALTEVATSRPTVLSKDEALRMIATGE